MEGWICLHRKILKWEWYHDNNTFRVFMHLLLSANWKDTKYMGMVVKRGSLVVKQIELAEELKLSRQQIRRTLNNLKESEIITIKSYNKFTLVTIVNYRDYQDKDNKEQPTNNQQTTNEQPTNNQQTTSIDKQGKQLNNITNNNKIKENNTNVGCCQDNFIKNYLNNINPVASPMEIEKLSSWEDDIDPKLINKAIEIAVNNNVRKYLYINAILNNWLKDNIKTLEQYENLEKIKQQEKEDKNGDRLEKRSKYPTTNGGSSTNNKPTAEDFRKIIEGR